MSLTGVMKVQFTSDGSVTGQGFSAVWSSVGDGNSNNNTNALNSSSSASESGCQDDATFDAGYGGCSMYGEGGANVGWCYDDDACDSCYCSCADECSGGGLYVSGSGSGSGSGSSGKSGLPLQQLMNSTMSQCAIQAASWREIRHNSLKMYSRNNIGEARYVYGGLGELMQIGIFEVWVCDRQDPCIAMFSVLSDDYFCYAFNEETQTFQPLDLVSTLRKTSSLGCGLGNSTKC